MRELYALTDTLIREAFGELDPLRASSDSIPTSTPPASPRCSAGIGGPDVKRLFLAALTHVGVDLERTYWRAATPG